MFNEFLALGNGEMQDAFLKVAGVSDFSTLGLMYDDPAFPDEFTAIVEARYRVLLEEWLQAQNDPAIVLIGYGEHGMFTGTILSLYASRWYELRRDFISQCTDLATLEHILSECPEECTATIAARYREVLTTWLATVPGLEDVLTRYLDCPDELKHLFFLPQCWGQQKT